MDKNISFSFPNTRFGSSTKYVYFAGVKINRKESLSDITLTVSGKTDTIKKLGLITHEELADLASKGVITPQTHLETESGRQGLAGQVSGLNFLKNRFLLRLR